MLIDPPIEELLPLVENRYILSLLTAKRARQLVDGGQPLSERRSNVPLTQASMELAESKLKYVVGDHPVVVPLRPEVEAERLEAQRQAMAKQQEALQEEAKLAESAQISPADRKAQERAETEALQEQNARDFTAQLLEIIGKQDDEMESEDDE